MGRTKIKENKMNYYKDKNNNVKAFDNNQLKIDFIQERIKNEGLIFISEEEMEEIINPPKTLDELKTNKLSEIKSAFEYQESNGTIFVDNDTFEIDARRTDKDNMDDLIKYSDFPINYVGKTTTRPNTTKEDLESFRKAVFDYGIANYGKKWLLETQVAQATTKEELELIKW